MTETSYQLEYYLDDNGKAPFLGWMYSMAASYTGSGFQDDKLKQGGQSASFAVSQLRRKELLKSAF
jgi:hypothetical protein